MLKIRLMRIGAKKRPFYRVVVIDERSKRNGAYIENVGTYDPMTTPHDIKLKQDRIDEWIKKGAQLSDGFLRIIGKAAQKPPRKPKKEKAAPKEEVVEKPVNETPVEGGEDSTASADQSLSEQDENQTSEPVASEESDASLADENGYVEPTEKIATEPEAPRNDENEEQK